jgi:hypothetical protein
MLLRPPRLGQPLIAPSLSMREPGDPRLAAEVVALAALAAAQLASAGPKYPTLLPGYSVIPSCVHRAIGESIEDREQLEVHVGLEQQLVVIGRAAVGDRQLHLPRVDPLGRDQLEQLRAGRAA